MELFIPVSGLAIGLLGLSFSVFTSLRGLAESRAIDVRFGKELGDKRLAIQNIDKITKAEIEEILTTLGTASGELDVRRPGG
ncbi:hypothetical protein [Pseudovibrio sp. Alg231-02]|uniref:hypothetical protein n=1 Tax=Pseudovibrio sp. Alg231-02 TaxID=1922223 RepID=UPI000D55AEF7|nr:hypothetical protein [Pseudovibrio sp. Alg231-02]